jgi:ferredoxin
MENLSPPQHQEAALLARAGFGPQIRLGCQAVLVGRHVTVERLVPADQEEEAARDLLASTSAQAGAG